MNICVKEDPDMRWIASSDVIIVLVANPSEFPVGQIILAQMKPEFDFEDWLRDFAVALSRSPNTQTICDGTRYGNTSSPYWSLVWDNGSNSHYENFASAY
jgi:hypothetical protein